MSYDIDNPPLPAGYNCDDNDGDYVNGSGTNWPQWPLLFDAFEGMVPLVISKEMLDVFLKECADVVFSAPANIVTFPWIEPVIVIRGDGCSTVGFMPSVNTVTFPQGVREVAVKEVA